MPVLPLVYMITAISFFIGIIGWTGLLLPSFSTSEKDVTFQLSVVEVLESIAVSSSSKYMTFVMVFRLEPIVANFLSCLASQINVDA